MSVLFTIKVISSFSNLSHFVIIVPFTSRDPLGYLIEQNVLESAGEGNFFKTLREFMYTQVDFA